ncbi:THAP domain-containing protein 1-like isoform X1 [Spodoptera litura]|uniref:THAP domain-containing protein 1-like isoform X1 n=1 Tax=Spodoptera litura TaxID=69820 RepID=A0A9J7E381_SPOLT|nr:THAP domain-containing protein 1-like isoform X1 [Spodoptera litura]
MPKKCCIKGCGMKYDKASGISLHKFPQNEELCQKWLERIGFENMNPELKVPKVCSRHFPESDFNRTLGVIRLRDDVVPSIHLVPSKKTHEPALYEIETVNEDAVSTSSIESQPTLPVEHIYIRSEKPSKKTHEPALYEIENVKEEAVSTTSIESQPTLPVDHIYIRSEKVQHQPSNLQKNERIQEICIKQRKEIKKLRQRIRRQDQKILKMENIINDLKKRGIIIISLD